MRFWPRREIETKAAVSDVTIPEQWLFELFGATPASAGISVSATSALTVPAVQSAVRVIAESAASLTARVKRIEGSRETDAPEHPVQALIDVQVSDWADWFTLIRDIVSEANCHDAGGFAWCNRTNGSIREIIKFDTGLLQATTRRNGETAYKIDNRDLDPADVIHLRGPFSKSPLSLAREAIGTALVMERHQAKFFANGARPGGVLETPKAIGDEGVKKMLGGWKAAHQGADNSGKTPLLWDGTTYRPLTMNSTDAQFLELRKFVIIEIARAFRVPPSMLFELDRATWSNSEQMGREFLVYCLEPWLKALEGALRRALFTPEERPAHKIVFERDDLTRADLGARATAYSSLISSRVINPNTARKWEGEEPYDGGDEYANPNTGSNQPGNSRDVAKNDGGEDGSE